MTEKKEHIINTAIELFAEKGFEGSSVRDLATRAGVNLAMVNYYFGSKDKLFEAIVEHKAAFVRGRLDEIAADASLNEIEKMDAVAESYVTKVLSDPSFHKLMYQELLVAERHKMHENIIRLFVTNSRTVREIIEKGIRKKIFNKVDVKMTMATIMGTINQALLSKPMCAMLMDGESSFDPYTDPAFRARLIKHLQQLMRAFLLKKD